MAEPGSTQRAPRILIVGLNYAPEPTGIGPYTTGLAEHLAERGWQVDVVAAKPYYPQWRIAPGFGKLGWKPSEERGVGIVRCPLYVPRRQSGARRGIHHLSFALAALPVVVTRALWERPDIVLCVMPSLISAPIARLAAWLRGSAYWIHIQDFEVDAAFATGLLRGGALARFLLRFERTLLRGAQLISTIGPRMVAKLAEKGVQPDRIYEFRNWATISEGASGTSYRRRWNLEGKHVALYSGSIGRKQGAGLILEAARLLAHRRDIAFVICAEGPELEALRASCHDIANLVIHPLQPREHLGDLLALADCHLLPQTAEAADLVLPSKLTNMLASGRPVLATAAAGTGLAEEIADCGLVVAPGDAQALARAIERLADDRGLAAQFGAAAALRARQRWDRATILADLEARLRLALPARRH